MGLNISSVILSKGEQVFGLDCSFLFCKLIQSLVLFFLVIQVLGEQLKLRQQVIATATVYFKRFYARNSLKCIDPLLLAPTCVGLASKVEEFGVISNSRLITTCSTVGRYTLFLLRFLEEMFKIILKTCPFHFFFPVKNKLSYAYTTDFPYRTNNILECEFYLLENLDCCLIVYQPYRPLLQLLQDIGHDEQLFGLAWRVVNDSLRTDVCLLYPPYQIAIGKMPMKAHLLLQLRNLRHPCSWYVQVFYFVFVLFLQDVFK